MIHGPQQDQASHRCRRRRRGLAWSTGSPRAGCWAAPASVHKGKLIIQHVERKMSPRTRRFQRAKPIIRCPRTTSTLLAHQINRNPRNPWERREAGDEQTISKGSRDQETHHRGRRAWGPVRGGAGSEAAGGRGDRIGSPASRRRGCSGWEDAAVRPWRPRNIWASTAWVRRDTTACASVARSVLSSLPSTCLRES
jgi:hypothetical protein